LPADDAPANLRSVRDEQADRIAQAGDARDA
jgi:hypothetical protein